ncbi:hypothetical protein AVEN_236231-1 [Araneus ventricosus]|uniref:Uncharacterized protein n=1 Tax=Araneus ventricosus TaxID=182803 RepID=A0A4Y2CAR1_ARAVE|nr:hypothetical protein AVEN_236231-1 [Araneus ventricosus]
MDIPILIRSDLNGSESHLWNPPINPIPTLPLTKASQIEMTNVLINRTLTDARPRCINACKYSLPALRDGRPFSTLLQSQLWKTGFLSRVC